jgi:hypothetical protein
VGPISKIYKAPLHSGGTANPTLRDVGIEHMNSRRRASGLNSNSTTQSIE